MTYDDLTHTPGPWIVNAEQVFGNGYKIASINDAGHNWQADRDLIAAAPDLLAALWECEAYFRPMAEDGQYLAQKRIDVIRAAIAKAEGTS